MRETFDGGSGSGGRLITGDNLLAMAGLLAEGYAGRFTLIYLDPPYGTESEFALRRSGGVEPAYRDTWGEAGLGEYLRAIYPRLQLLRELLSLEGTVWIHLDRRTCHYVQVLMDEIFGRKCCQNVVVWRREVARGRKASARYFGNNVEYLLCYTRSPGGGVWNPIVEERVISREEAERRYCRDERGFFSTSHRGTYSDAALLALAREGRVHVTRGGKLIMADGRVGTTRGTIRVKYYLEPRGRGFVKRYAVDNLWEDIRGIAEAGRERCGYPTQKPERLLERIIQASSRPGDLVGDFYAGSGTTGVVAARLGRPWVMVDDSTAAIAICQSRLRQQGVPFTLEVAGRSGQRGGYTGERSCR
ncbi:MAG: DNA methyltransferase [Betaproteobacteria bacterium]